MNDELIAALEKATGPCRELDAEIGRFAAASFLGYVPDRPQRGCAPYTARIDAALKLVPEGWSYEARQGLGGYPHIWDLLTIKSGDVRYTRVTGRAKSAALAICIAALRAREVVS